jgi:zinc transport system ATP-binding protein
MKPIVKVEKVSFSYEEEEILTNVDLTIDKGDFAAFIGSNGSGKSTLFKLMLGLEEVNKGIIEFFGERIEDFTDWTRVGYISQDVREFNDSFPGTVREVIGANLYSQMNFWKVLNSDLEVKIEQVLNLVGLEGFKDRQLGNLSGGQQQRVFIARTLVTDPEVIFLDEPLVGVDPEAQHDFYQLLNQLNEELEITVVMISHDVHVVSDQATKVVCFNKGQVFSHQGNEFCYDDYYDFSDGTGKVLVPEHRHQAGNDN